VEDEAPIPPKIAPSSLGYIRSQVDVLDELRRRVEALDAISANIRIAIETNQLDALGPLRTQFDAIRDEIISDVHLLVQQNG
jgi:hypothetical protein